MVSRNRRFNESYSDINSSNAWDAYDTAIEYLGADGLCEALAKAMGTDELASNLEYIFRMYEIPFGDDEFDESVNRRKKSIKEYIDNSDTIEFLENAFEKLRYHSKNLNKTQYYLFSIAYDSFQEYRNGNGTERDIYKKCREFAEYCQTHNKNLTKMQDSLVDDILSNT